MKRENNITQAWKLFEKGRDYNKSLVPSQYAVVNTNTEFFIGNQWINLPDTPAMRGIAKPTFNILKRVASLFIASLTSSGVTLRFEPLAYYDGGNSVDPDRDAATFANAEVANLWEKLKMDYRVRDALFDGAQVGDYCMHFYFDPYARPYGGTYGAYRGEIKCELVDGINVMFGNPSDRRVSEQPWILLVGRDTVEHLREEAKQFKKDKKNQRGGKANSAELSAIDASIQPDNDTEEMTGIGGKTELEASDDTGKALYCLLYTKVTTERDMVDPETDELVYEEERDANGEIVYETDEDGKTVVGDDGKPVPKRVVAKEIVTSIHVTKATRNAVIYEDVDTGLSEYPIAWGNWEKQKNQYHGRALVTGLIPNQIFINTAFASAMRHMQTHAFPKVIYNADVIPKWTNAIGEAIGVRGLPPGQSIGQVATTLHPAEMSNQIFALIDRAIAQTKECLGATDAQMGNVKPDNTSALMVLQTNAEVPLENIRSNLYEWIEDVGHILLDMIGTYYGKRPVIVDEEFKELVIGANGVPNIDPVTGQLAVQTIVRKVVHEYDFSKFKHIGLNLRVDVGATTYFSEIAMTQTLDNLRQDGTLDVIQYLERIPDKLIPKKQELIDELKGRIAEGTQANAAAGAALPKPGSPLQGVATGGDSGASLPVQGGPLSPGLAVQGLAGHNEAAFDALPNIAKKTALSQGALRAGG